ncbi:bifunctional glutamate N-acetyltransferase/amino-acid acetyltransferase ArgJ [Breznakiella homolactica]|uniref:Arginine biosynthesis bifunctional protein ArgJ n=1 Tax=Breznakiella homolactica TaxID=2798577 RepID=A0A7T7XMS9_9SPIR|nr:bifunctional glutamate N-acetyltransferase/amino-acid acetyltransferase ArgJ [Breznakiella homolactica]QQO09220.1 bifunctional glutamate N-acetyltransferase/amino-acid acetyltransferase ArgJ [Breznakiella homolactica]
MKEISGGVCAPKGFRAGGIWCGIKASQSKRDLALIYSEKPCTASAMYTRNRVKAASILVSQINLASGRCHGVIANSGNANACTGAAGLAHARRMAQLAAEEFMVEPNSLAVASTGVIGVPLPIDKIEAAMGTLADSLRSDAAGHEAALEAIMTTDTRKKDVSLEIEIAGVPVRLGAMVKGSGMIHPNMATMLCFITTDAVISRDLLDRALRKAVNGSFNRVTVDGDTSTNDMVLVLANGQAGNSPIESEDTGYEIFAEALGFLCVKLAKAMARDGEGATKLLACTVSGAENETAAEVLAKSIAGSSLVKTACFGADANWGRVLCAMGYSGIEFDPDTVDVRFASSAGEILVCRNGASVPFSEEEAKRILSEEEIEIIADIRAPEGHKGRCTVWGCDLTYDYVKINGDYRS